MLRVSDASLLKAIYQIPLCFAFILLVVQGLRAGTASLLDYVIRHAQDEPE